MKTLTSLKNEVAGLCNVSLLDTTLMTILTANLNDSIRTMSNLQGGKLRFLEATKNMSTVASQESYQIPNKFRKIIDLYIADAETIYSPEMVFDPTRWKLVKQANLGTGDVPQFTYVENQTFSIQPIPASSGLTITVRGRLNVRDLNTEDYTIGTITSIANQGTAVVGASTTWTADMVGRYINIPTTTSANGGDGFWYEIGGWTDATHITLLKPYEGTAISAGTASYTIGQVPIIPEAYQPAIAYRATALYWQNQNDLTRAKTYWMLYDGGNEAGYSKSYGGLIGQMLENEGETEEGSYIPPFGSASTLPNVPFYYPSQNATGFN